MSHFAEINSDNIVTRVIVADQESIDSGDVGDSSNWIQTSYNTRGGKHYPMITTIDENKKILDEDGNVEDEEGQKVYTPSTISDGDGLRKNYAGVGYTYDATRDAFYAPQPYPSWTLDGDTCLWEPPTAMPDDDGKFYHWDEDTTSWVGVEIGV
jgi:hypothetical protein